MNGYMKPQDIEKRSFEIITAELGERTFPAGIAEVVKRVIHTTADFDYADRLAFFAGCDRKGKGRACGRGNGGYRYQYGALRGEQGDAGKARRKGGLPDGG